MGKGLPRSLAHANLNAGAIVGKKVFPLNALAVTLAGATGVGFGTAVLGDFAEGNLLFLGAVAYVQVTKDATATGIAATFDGDYSIGTTPTADATLSGTDANIVGSAALGAATAGVSPVARGSGVTAVILDNTDGSLELNLNLIIDDANISADTQLVHCSGYVEVVYVVLGDD